MAAASQAKGMNVKVYLVLVPNNVAGPGQANVTIKDALLTRSAAQDIVDKIPGAYIEKFVARK